MLVVSGRGESGAGQRGGNRGGGDIRGGNNRGGGGGGGGGRSYLSSERGRSSSGGSGTGGVGGVGRGGAAVVPVAEIGGWSAGSDSGELDGSFRSVHAWPAVDWARARLGWFRCGWVGLAGFGLVMAGFGLARGWFVCRARAA